MVSGERFGRYTIQSELGRGGMATVFLAYDNHRRHTVALKVLPRTFLHDPTFRERFEREARLIMQLEHDAIVPVYDYGEIDGQPYIAMRLMRGGSLKERLQAGALSPAETDAIMRRIGSALEKAHARGIVHRDLKPGNILFDDEGLAYLADFGIARLVEGTQTVTLIGTPQYMAPEQAHGQPIDQRTDVYQMGVVLFEMLTGRVPFDAPTPAAMLYQHAHTPAPPVRDFNAALPEAISSVVQQALAKDKTQRFQNMKALFTAFSAARHGVVPPSPQDVTWIEPPPPPPPPTASRDRDGGVPLWATVVGVFALLLIIGGSVFAVREWLDRRGQPPTLAERDSLVDPPPGATSPAAAVSPTAQPTVELTPTPRPSATQEPTATPVPTATPQPTPTWTPLPTATPTWTPIPPPTATPQPTPCAIAVAGTFSSLWQADLGCATGGAAGTFMAMEDFERGRMIWREDSDGIYVIYSGGSWASYADIWREGDPEFSCGTQQSPPSPKRGFGKIWCTHSNVQSGLGLATNGEWGAQGTVQPFANGTILRAGDGRTYVLLGNGRWR